MLKTNNKKVIERVKKWILEDLTAEDLEEEKENPTEGDYFDYIAKTFINAEYKTPWQRQENLQKAFSWWLSGLPFNFADYHYNIKAVDLVGDWLEQTPQERNKYTEDQAESLADYLIFKVLYPHILENL